jgi:acetyl-CoA carboxylase biotin carboxyl carrier protein
MIMGRRPPLAPDVEIIRSLAGLLGETGLTEIEYAVGDLRIRVAREPAGTVAAEVNNGHAPAPAVPIRAEPATQNEAEHPGTLTSPMVGIAYLAPQPGEAPFVCVGDSVIEGQTLLVIEAMKVMNQICARRAGRVARILVADADPVEYGAPLMLIE